MSRNAGGRTSIRATRNEDHGDDLLDILPLARERLEIPASGREDIQRDEHEERLPPPGLEIPRPRRRVLAEAGDEVIVQVADRCASGRIGEIAPRPRKRRVVAEPGELADYGLRVEEGECCDLEVAFAAVSHEVQLRPKVQREALQMVC